MNLPAGLVMENVAIRDEEEETEEEIMPRGDKRGPNGDGPMTGRQRGFCAGYDEPGYVDNDFGYGGGRGNGRGRNRRNFVGRGVNRRPYGTPVRYIEEEREVETVNNDILDRIDALAEEIKELKSKLKNSGKK